MLRPTQIMTLLGRSSLEVLVSDFFSANRGPRSGDPLKSSAIATIWHVAKWLIKAHDATGRRGISTGYHLWHKWQPVYPEVTGYIIVTFYDLYHLLGDEEFKTIATWMADWEMSIQLQTGAFQAGYETQAAMPCVFDTGQVIQGLIRAYIETGAEKFLLSAQRAANWLTEVQEPDGSWHRFEFAGIPYTFQTRVAWPLLQLYQIVTGKQDYLQASVANLEWALSNMEADGWLEHCSIHPNAGVFTHTLAYAIEGFIESGLILEEQKYIDAAQRIADRLLSIWEQKGEMPGEFSHGWQTRGNYTCLTGDAQIALCWLKLYKITKEPKYLTSAIELNKYITSTVIFDSTNRNIRGAVKGSHPIWGKYAPFFYPSWAAKFLIDSLIAQEALMPRTLSHQIG